MKKFSFVGAVLLALFLCATCANPSGGGSDVPGTSASAEINFVKAFGQDGYFIAWIVKSDGKCLTDESGNVSYKWFRSDADGSNVEEIAGQTVGYYKYNDAVDKDKVICAKVTYNGKEYECKTQTVLGVLVSSEVVSEEVYYDVGTEILSENLEINDLNSDTEGIDFSDAKVSFAKAEYFSENNEDAFFTQEMPSVTVDESGFYPVVVKKAGYPFFIDTVWITVVQSWKEGELPTLSKDTDQITRGFIKFDTVPVPFEWKFEGGDWAYYNVGAEIQVASGKNVIYVRKPAVGSFFEDGYLGPSDEEEIQINEDNIGTDVSGIPSVIKPIVFDTRIQNDDILIEVGSLEGTLYFVADIQNSALAEQGFDFKWTINDKSADSYSGVEVKGESLTINENSSVPKDCLVDIEVFAYPKAAEGIYYHNHLKRKF